MDAEVCIPVSWSVDLARYPFVSIEDPFDQDDWESYTKFQETVGDSQQIVGDDLLVTQDARELQGNLRRRA